MGAFIQWIRRRYRFLKHELWRQDLRRLTGPKRLGLAALRVAAHVWVAFTENLAGIRAAGLTLITLLALVPFLALVFSVANYLGLGNFLDDQLTIWATNGELPAGLQEALQKLQSIIRATNFGAIGTFGTIVVVWSAFVAFGRVETAFNHVWRVRTARPWLRRISDFVTLVVVLPPCMAAALFLQSVLGSVQSGSVLPGWLSWMDPVIQAGAGFLPYPLTWMGFAILYKLMPSARVRWMPAIWAGVVAGSGWLVLHAIYVRFQVGAAQANAIYASLAAIPLLVVYLQLTWTVILAGVEVSYAIQNLRLLRGADHLPPASFAIRKRLAWHVLHKAAEGFQQGQRGCDLGRLSRELDVPREWLDRVVQALTQAGLLVAPENQPEVVMPGRPPDAINMAEAMQALEERASASDWLERVRLPGSLEADLEQAEDAFAAVIEARHFEVDRD